MEAEKLPFSPYLISEWTGPEMIDRKTWTAYTADQMIAFRDAALAAQSAEIEAMKADAERYRWLRNESAPTMDPADDWKPWAAKCGALGNDLLFGDALDKSIDAARQAAGGVK